MSIIISEKRGEGDQSDIQTNNISKSNINIRINKIVNGGYIMDEQNYLI